MMTLLYISLILLLATELLYEGHFGDKHGFNSALSLTTFFVIAAALGLLVGNYYSAFTYLFLRVGLFDLSFGKLFRTGYFYLGQNTTDKIQAKLPKGARAFVWSTFIIISLIINFLT
jgi:hypothetical protein